MMIFKNNRSNFIKLFCKIKKLLRLTNGGRNKAADYKYHTERKARRNDREKKIRHALRAVSSNDTAAAAAKIEAANAPVAQ